MQLVTIGTYDNLIEAELAKLQLESACIDAVLKDAEMVHLMPIYNLTIGGIKLLVRQVDEQKATTILENLETTSEITCPYCDSTQIYINYKSTKSKKGRLAVFLSFLTSTYPPLHYDVVHKCKDCGELFKPDEAR